MPRMVTRYLVPLALVAAGWLAGGTHLPGAPAVLPGFVPLCFAVSPEGEIVAAGAGSYRISPWGSARPVRLPPHTSLALGPDGAIYAADCNHYVVRRVDRSGATTPVAGDGRRWWRGDGGPATKASLMYAEAVAAARDGTLYIADGFCVRKVDARGIISTVAGERRLGHPEPAGGRVWALAVDRRGRLYVSGGHYSVWRVDGGSLTTVTTGDYVQSLAFDAAGRLYTLQLDSPWIGRVDAGGVVTGVIGSRSGLTGDGVPARLLQLGEQTTGLASDGSGSLYFAQAYVDYPSPISASLARIKGRVRKVDRWGIVHTAVSGCGRLSGR